MSTDAVAWVFKRSPYKLAGRLIHLAIADIVNDTYGNRLFAGDAALAEKAGVSRGTVVRQKAQMIADGYLEQLGRPAPGQVAEYRFLMPDVSQIATRSTSANEDPDVRDLGLQRARSAEPVLLPTKGTQGTQEAGADAPLSLVEGDSSEIDRLCLLLADCLEAHGRARPKITKQWTRDMDLLVRRGPTDWAEPAAIKPGAVAKVVRGIFAHLAAPSASGFCWADVIRSPGALRTKWDTLVLALRRAEQPASPRPDPVRRGGTPLADQVQHIRDLERKALPR